MKASQLTKLFNRTSKFITGMTILSFILLISIGIFNCANPIMQSQMTMEGSYYSVMADCIPGKDCEMDINTHLSIWQGMFRTNLNADFFSLFVSLMVLGFAVIFYTLLGTPKVSALVARYLNYERDHRDNKLYNYFLHIFAHGIIQPKIFA